MEKCSEALTKGVALLIVVAGFAASRDGGLGRLIANGGRFAYAALVCTVLSVLLAFRSWITLSVSDNDERFSKWKRLVRASVILFGLGVASILLAVRTADQALERPMLILEQATSGLKVSATLERMRADQLLRTTVHGYPPGADSRVRRELLFNSTSGPDARGKATVSGVITASLADYEVVELRAFRGLQDPGCEQLFTKVIPLDRGPGACASLWIVPLKGT